MIDTKKLDYVLKRVNKPARYIGDERNSVEKDFNSVDVRFAFGFPDVYEVAMSHLGMHILYNLINDRDDMLCERVFAPWEDMESLMREHNIPLYGLESKEEIINFDVLGFTLQYEMSYTNILNMMDLAKIPFKSVDRDESHPLIVAGGPCAYNPEPLAEIIDLFMIGEGEEIIVEVFELLKDCKMKGLSRAEFLLLASRIQGVYVPSLYEVEYNEDKTIKSFEPSVESVNPIVKKRYISDVEAMYQMDRVIVPFIETVHDRAVLEVFRGCTHGCRFCQAGMIYRPIREKSSELLLKQADDLIASTGYQEVSLSSLSSCDHTEIDKIAVNLMDKYVDEKVAISLPSLRLDSFSIDLLKQIEKVKRTGLTFAPEAGTQRLRDVINKGVNEENFVNAVSSAFENGWSRVKLYFMVGLPTETNEDLDGIKDMSYLVRDLFFNRNKKDIRGNLQVVASASCFVPKPFTPFQWFKQNTADEFYEKLYYTKDQIKEKKIKFQYHDPKLSILEGLVARGDRRVGEVIISAWEKGCKFDGWSEFFQYDKWIEAMEENDISFDFYNFRERSFDEILPWDFIDINVSKAYLQKEYENAIAETVTPDCRRGCNNCGIEDCEMWSVFR
ncbi:MAG: TIGR03960 family B12-binding radical SAM protein [Tissierellia bacterium]|nr:TIGR03960 family B12-binding radical SAM protein [Tissierellia bacterium]